MQNDPLPTWYRARERKPDERVHGLKGALATILRWVDRAGGPINQHKPVALQDEGRTLQYAILIPRRRTLSGLEGWKHSPPVSTLLHQPQPCRFGHKAQTAGNAEGAEHLL